MTARRFIPAIVIALVLSGTAVSQAQIVCTIPCPVWDFSAIARHTALAVLQQQLNDRLSDQNQRFVKMATRLARFTPLKKYVIEMDDTPEWRIHDWFTGANVFSGAFLSALTYGDASGTGYESVVLRRAAPAPASFRALSDDARNALVADLAVLDIADSTIVRGTHETGRLRFNGREEARAIARLQDDVTDEDDTQSVTAVMDKVASATVIETQNKQARIQFLAAILEQQLVESLRARNALVHAMNMITAQIADNGKTARTLVQGSTASLRGWRQP